MNRREMLTTTALGTAGFVTGTGFSAPACGVSKERAVKVAGLVIELAKQSTPLLDLLGARDITVMVDAKVIPALEKLRDALEDVDIPSSQSMLANVRSVLGGVATALLNLPDSPRRTTIIGILASVNMLLLTVEAFIESEVPEATATTSKSGVSRAMKPSDTGDKVMKVFEASRP